MEDVSGQQKINLGGFDMTRPLYLKSVQYKEYSALTMSDVFAIPELDVKICSPETKALIRGLHCAIGIETEITELFEACEHHRIDIANLGEEIGDVCWYLAEFERQLGIELDHDSALSRNYGFNGIDNTLASMKISGGRILDAYKKGMFYGKPLPYDQIKLEISNLFIALTNVVDMAGLDLEKIRGTNIKKLYKRFGLCEGEIGFSVDKAINRKLADERKILEEGLKQ